MTSSDLTFDVRDPTSVGKIIEMPPTSPQQRFGMLLRQFREACGLTQADAAETVDVSRANFAQWETGKYLPAEWRITKLDDGLAAGGRLIAAAAAVRPPEHTRAVTHDEGLTKSLLEVLADVRKALLDQLVLGADLTPRGWRHNLVANADDPSVLSTTYGLKALAMLGDPHPSTRQLVENVMERAARDAKGQIIGWRARTQPGPTMEATGPALDALLRVGAPIEVDDVVRILGGLLDDTARQRPFVLTCALEPLLVIAPDAPLVKDLVDALLACRVEEDSTLLWPGKRDSSIDQPGLKASVAHTARAVTALRKAPGERARAAVAAAEEWIVTPTSLDGVAEVIQRTKPEFSQLTVEHFTAAWVVRAIAGGADPRAGMGRALAYLWGRFDRKLSLWTSDNGEAPTWMLADAVVALNDAARAMLATPVDRDVG